MNLYTLSRRYNENHRMKMHVCVRPLRQGSAHRRSTPTLKLAYLTPLTALLLDLVKWRLPEEDPPILAGLFMELLLTAVIGNPPGTVSQIRPAGVSGELLTQTHGDEPEHRC